MTTPRKPKANKLMMLTEVEWYEEREGRWKIGASASHWVACIEKTIDGKYIAHVEGDWLKERFNSLAAAKIIAEEALGVVRK